MNRVKGKTELDTSLVRLYVLYRTSVGQFSSADIAGELGVHGYGTSAAAVGQVLRGLESKGYVRSVRGKAGPKLYKATGSGLKAVDHLRASLQHLRHND